MAVNSEPSDTLPMIWHYVLSIPFHSWYSNTEFGTCHVTSTLWNSHITHSLVIEVKFQIPDRSEDMHIRHGSHNAT